MRPEGDHASSFKKIQKGKEHAVESPTRRNKTAPSTLIDATGWQLTPSNGAHFEHAKSTRNCSVF